MPLFASPRIAPLATTDLTLGDDALYFARLLARAKGTAMPAPDGSLNHADNLAFGAAIRDAVDGLDAMLNQVFPDSATFMLPELEQLYGLPVGTALTTAQRQARLVARVRSSAAGTPQSIVAALTPITTTWGVPSIVENAWSAVLAAPRNVFLFAVVIPGFIAYPAPADVVAVLEQMKPAHTSYNVTNQVGFLTDDPNSVTDLTVISA